MSSYNNVQFWYRKKRGIESPINQNIIWNRMITKPSLRYCVADAYVEARQLKTMTISFIHRVWPWSRALSCCGFASLGAFRARLIFINHAINVVWIWLLIIWNCNSIKNEQPHCKQSLSVVHSTRLGSSSSLQLLFVDHVLDISLHTRMNRMTGSVCWPRTKRYDKVNWRRSEVEQANEWGNWLQTQKKTNQKRRRIQFQSTRACNCCVDGTKGARNNQRKNTQQTNKLAKTAREKNHSITERREKNAPIDFLVLAQTYFSLVVHFSLLFAL